VTSLGDLQAFQDLPRLVGLAVSPDGARLVTTVATPDPERTRFRSALWDIDPAGARPARRLTRGTGESAPAFLPGGDLLFTSARPDPDRKEPDPDAPAALWRLPTTGEARQPRQVLEGLQVAERGHGMSTSLPVVRRAWRSSCAVRASWSP
jgi:hypothetical protein